MYLTDSLSTMWAKQALDAHHTETPAMDIERIQIDQINPAPYNPRVALKSGDPEFEKLRRSLEEFGCVEPLIWNQRTGNLVGGHQRLSVLTDQGATAVDVSVVDLSEAKEKALNIALNKISGDWDEVKLADLLGDLIATPEIDVELTGFDLPDAEDLIADILEPGDEEKVETFDVEAELRERRPVVTQEGELIELGQHRLLCGDCTDAIQVRRLMDGQRAVLFATDPPYLVNYDGSNHPGTKGKSGFTWDDADANPDLYDNFIRIAIEEAIRPNAAWYCWHASRRQAMVEAIWEKYGAFAHQQILWAKHRPVLGRSWYLWQHEPCFFGWVRPNRPPRQSAEHLATVWQIPNVRTSERAEHPTSKPAELFAVPMRQHTRRGEVCYEPFCGSGSQLIAAEKLGRRCFAIEISPRYCDVIVRRWIAFVGEDNAPAELVNRYRITEEVTL